MDRGTVLIIDDDPDFRELMSISLESMGFSALSAPDCSTAMAVFEREHEHISTVLLDYLMPGMVPCDCIAALMAQPHRPRVILVTAAADPAARAAELGCDQWLSKPFSQKQLEHLLA
jgi:CheY-like chemotaxis protein